MTYSPEWLINSIDRSLDATTKRELKFAQVLPCISRNPSMIDWAFDTANQRFYSDKIRTISRKYLAACPSDTAMNHLTNARRDPKWMMSRREESPIHYFWLSANPHQSAVRLIRDRMRFPMDESRDDSNVWMNMMCRNPATEIVDEVVECFHHTDETQLIFDIDANYSLDRNAIHLGKFASNPSAAGWVIDNLREYFESDDDRYSVLWKGLSNNPNPTAIEYMYDHPNRVDMVRIAENPNLEAIALMQDLNDDPHSWNWRNLSYNPAAIGLLKQHEDLIDYEWLGANPHPWAIKRFHKWFIANARLHKNKRVLNNALALMVKWNFRDAWRHQWVSFN